MLDSLAPFWAWLKANPLALVIIWPLFTAVVTFVFRAHSDEELAEYPKWFAVILKICASFGVDSRRLLDAVRGRIDGLIIVLVVGAMLMFSACKPSATPRETARATVLVLADAVRQLDTACAQMATARHDVTLATRCADGYDTARASLLAAESTIDVYDSGKQGDLPCAVARAADAVQHVVDAIVAAGGKAPAVAADALRLAPVLSVACHG